MANEIVKFGSVAVLERDAAKMPAGAPDRVKDLMKNKDPEFLYFFARAITANVPNGNGDFFPLEEVEASYQTFIDKHIDYNHDLTSPKTIIGKIVDAWMVKTEKEAYAMILGKIDKVAHPEISRQILKEILDHVSMEAMVASSECNICGHTIRTQQDKKCEHLTNSLLKMCDYQGGQKQCYAVNRGVKFTGLGVVLTPADQMADISFVAAAQAQKLIKYASAMSETKQVGDYDFLASQMTELMKQMTEEKQLQDVAAQVQKILRKGEGAQTVNTKKTKEEIVQEVKDKLTASEYQAVQEQIKQELAIPKQADAPVAVPVTPTPEVPKAPEAPVVSAAPVAPAEPVVAAVVETKPVEPIAAPVAAQPVPVENKIDMELVDKADLKDSYWVFTVNGEPKYSVSLGSIWKNQLMTHAVDMISGKVIEMPKEITNGKIMKVSDFAVSNIYKLAVSSNIKAHGLEKVMQHLGGQVWPSQRPIGNGQYEIGLQSLPKTKTEEGIDLNDSGTHESERNKALRNMEQKRTQIKTVYNIGSEAPAGIEKKADEPAADFATAGPKPPISDLPPAKLDEKPKPLIPEVPKKPEDKGMAPKIDAPKAPGKKDMTPAEAVDAIMQALQVIEKKQPNMKKFVNKALAVIDAMAAVLYKDAKPKKEEKAEKKEEKAEDKKEEKKEEKPEAPKADEKPKDGEKPGEIGEKPKANPFDKDKLKDVIKASGLSETEVPIDAVVEAIEDIAIDATSHGAHKKQWESLGGSLEACEKAVDGVDNPKAFCSWLEHAATGKWPSEASQTVGIEKKADDVAEVKPVEAAVPAVEPVVAPVVEPVAVPAVEPAVAPVAVASVVGPALVAPVMPVVEAKPVKTDREIELENQLKVKDMELRAQNTKDALQKKNAMCINVLRGMVERDLVVPDQKEVSGFQAQGLEVFEAQKAALKVAQDRQMADLWKMDSYALKAFADSISRVPKRADIDKSGKFLKTAILPKIDLTTGGNTDEEFFASLPWK